MVYNASFFTWFALLLVSTYLRTEFGSSLAHCIVLDHDQASQSVLASPEFYTKCEKELRNNGSYRVPLGQTKKLSFNTYKYSVCLVVILTSTDLATDKATCHLERLAILLGDVTYLNKKILQLITAQFSTQCYIVIKLYRLYHSYILFLRTCTSSASYIQFIEY